MEVEQRAQDPDGCPRDETQQVAQSAAQPVNRTQAESPQAFYKRVTKWEDVRRLLQKLARR
jgi:hypothetical protein